MNKDMDKQIKQLLIIWLITVVVILVSLAALNVYAAPAEQSSCPAGTTIMEGKTPDNVLCKINPTGCPYGDSMPMSECYKNEPQPVAQITVEIAEGK